MTRFCGGGVAVAIAGIADGETEKRMDYLPTYKPQPEGPGVRRENTAPGSENTVPGSENTVPGSEEREYGPRE